MFNSESENKPDSDVPVEMFTIRDSDVEDLSQCNSHHEIEDEYER